MAIMLKSMFSLGIVMSAGYIKSSIDNVDKLIGVALLFIFKWITYNSYVSWL